jgi:hypothetical protein
MFFFFFFWPNKRANLIKQGSIYSKMMNRECLGLGLINDCFVEFLSEW